MNGLILAGGTSSRMQIDKAFIEYHSMPQYLYLYQILSKFCTKTWVSHTSLLAIPTLIDDVKYQNFGPIAGLLTAFKHDNTDWFVVGIDYPFLKSKELEYIYNLYQTTKQTAVAFDTNSEFFEPFVAIYSADFLGKMISDVKDANFSLQKYLQTEPCQKICFTDNLTLINVNTLEQYELAKQNLLNI